MSGISLGHRLRLVERCGKGLVQGRVATDWNAQEWMELDPYQCIASRLQLAKFPLPFAEVVSWPVSSLLLWHRGESESQVCFRMH